MNRIYFIKLKSYNIYIYIYKVNQLKLYGAKLEYYVYGFSIKKSWYMVVSLSLLRYMLLICSAKWISIRDDIQHSQIINKCHYD